MTERTKVLWELLGLAIFINAWIWNANYSPALLFLDAVVG